MKFATVGIILLIHVCSYSISDAAGYNETCTDNANCTDTGQKCVDNVCDCDTDNNYSYVGDKCVKELGRECSSTSDCNDAAVICNTTSSTCKCNTATHYDSNGGANGGSCTARHGLGDICSDPGDTGAGDDQCTTDNALCEVVTESESTTYKCQCESGYLNSGTSCVAERSLGQTCTDVSQCTAQNVQCTGTGTKTCSCQAGYFGENNNCLKRSLGETCTDVTQCIAQNNVQCTGTCSCQAGFYGDNNSCLKRSLGQTCTDVSQCTAQNVQCTGTGTKTCSCQAGYFGENNNCLKRSLGETCTDVTQCIAQNNVQCTGTCSCQAGFYGDNNSCLKRSLGQTCTDVSQCTAQNVQCTGTGTKTCSCQAGYFGENNNCLKRNLGETCTDVTQCTTQNNVECTGPGTKTCSCQDGFYGDNNSCLKRSLSETCTDVSQCSAQNVECTGTGAKTCSCKSGFYTEGNSCLKRSLGQSCTDVSQCTTQNNVECTGTGTKTCSCQAGFYGGNNSCSKRSLGESCTDVSQCSAQNVACTGTGTKTCSCQVGYYTEGNSCLKRSLGQSCSDVSQCTTPNNVQCTGTGTKTCSCQAGYYGDNNNCLKRSLGQSCSDVSQCTTPNNVECTGTGTKTCSCQAGYYGDNNNCLRRYLDQRCSDSSQCWVAHGVCSASTCSCQSGYFQSGSGPTGSCTKRQLGETCSAANQCSAWNTVCSGSCQCRTGYYDTDGPGQIGGSCSLKVPVGGVCPQPSASVPNTATCLDSNARCMDNGNSYTCQCINTYYDNQENNRRCIIKKALGDVCSVPVNNINQCSDSSASCRQATVSSPFKCTCNAGYHQEPTGCVANKALGEDCNPASTEVECSDVAALCLDSKCTCKNDYFDSNRFQARGTCYPITNLKVSNVGFTSIQTNKMTVSWSAPEDFKQYIDKYTVQWRPANDNNIKVESEDLVASTTTLTLTRGIDPGRAYTVTIFSINEQTQQGSLRNTSVIRFQAAKPGKTSGIDWSNSDQNTDGGNIKVSWFDPTGYESGYNVKLLDGTTEKKNSSSSSQSVVFQSSGLKNGYRYTVTIQADSEKYDNGKTVQGEIFTAEFKTIPKIPDPPQNGMCKDPTDGSITLNWIAPTVPNGDLVRYNIQVYKDSTIFKYASTTGTEIELKVVGLEPGTSYVFRIYTENERGNSSRYDTVSSGCKTRARMSEAPTSLEITEVTSRGFDISWNKPGNTFSAENYGYVLQIKEQDICLKEIIYECSDCKGGFQISNLSGLCDSTLRTMVQKSELELESKLTYSAGLNPDITYTVTVTAINDEGRGHPVSKTETTNEEAPQAPHSVIVTDIRTTSMKVSWNIGTPRPGKTNFTIMLKADSPAQIREFTITGYDKREYMAEGLEEYWNYKVTVTAATSVGPKSSVETQQYRTLPAAPGKVSEFDIEEHPGGNYTQMKIKWQAPYILERNSIIRSYSFEYYATGRVTTTKNFTQESPQDHVYTVILPVKPEETYTLTVYAVNIDDQKGENITSEAVAPAGVPINIEETLDIEIIPKDSVKNVEETSFSVSLVLDFFTESSYGEIKSNGVTVCAKDCDFSGIKTKEDFNQMDNWKEAGKKLYRATPDNWITDIQNKNAQSRRKRAVADLDFTVGGDDCSQTTPGEYCNGPLQPDTSYTLVAVTCTNGGCLLSQEYGPFVTEAEPGETDNLGMIIGIVVAVVVLLVVGSVVAFVMLRRRRSGPGKMKPAKDSDDDDFTTVDPAVAKIPRKRPILLNAIEEYVNNMHRDSNLLFSSEYEDLKTLSPKHSCEAADKEENRMRNRYINIIPFDHTRVKLSTNGEDDSSDYINANYLPGYSSPREYIGCQGPIPGTIDDFWRMTWEQNVSVIVMLTLCKEGQKIKCEQYWPDEVGEPKQYGDVIVEITSYSNIRTYDYRMFKITNGNTTRVVKHFHFLSWLDFQANVHHDIILDFIQHVRQHVQPPDTSGPMIIHCSAGVGRTGTYIALDHLIQFINDHDFDVEIDVFDLVLKLRENRQHMVQTEQQYVFIHDCVKEIMDRKRRQMENIYENQAFSQDENIYQNEQTLYANVSVGKHEQNTEL